MIVNPGSTDVTTYFVMRLAASGAEATGLTITDFDLQYTRSGAAPSTKVDATALAATDSAHGDNQAIEIDATDQPGLYRVDWPDAAFAAGVREVILTVKCATAFTEHLRVELGPPVNVELWNATAVPAEHTAGYPIVTVKDGTGTGEINTNAGKVVGVELVDTLTTYTGNTVQTGDSFARIGVNGAGLSNITLPSGGLANVTAWTVAITGNITGNLSGSVGSVTGAVGSVTGAVGSVTGAVGSVTGAVGSVTGNVGGNVTGSIGSLAVQAKADVNAEVDTALADIHLDHLLATAAAGTECADSTYWARLVSKSATPAFSSYVNTTDSLEAIRDRGDAAWITATGFSTLDAAGVRTAVGLASANLDTQLDALPTATENADALLKRDWSSVTGESARSVLNALRKLRNEWSISGSTLTVKKEDDSTTAYTQTLTSSSTAEPITAIDN